jgi:hypothetical protein
MRLYFNVVRLYLNVMRLYFNVVRLYFNMARLYFNMMRLYFNVVRNNMALASIKCDFSVLNENIYYKYILAYFFKK